jgi:DNA-binding Lrp family transcriptional regulator
MIKLDKKDYQLLYELDLDSRMSSKELAKKIEISEQAVAYKINRLIKNNIITNFNLLVDISKLGFTHYKLYLRLQNLSSKKEIEFVDFLIKYKSIFWIVSVRGNFDYVISCWGKDIYDYQEFYNTLKNKYGEYIYAEDLVIVTNVPLFNRAYLIPNGEKKEIAYGGKKDLIQIDDLDKKILLTLSNDARLNYIELSKMLKISPDTIRYRFNKLKTSKVIIGSKLGLDPQKLNRQHLLISINLQNFNEDVLRKMELFSQNFNSILYYVNCIGSHNVDIECEVANEDDADNILKQFKTKFFEYIKNYTVLTVKKEYKLNFVPI